MGSMSHRKYKDAAERQRAYRERLKAGERPTSPPAKPAKPKRQSRPQRLAAIEEAVRDLAGEYQSWLENLPENLTGSALADDLQETVRQLEAIADDLAAVDPPRGFGR